MKRVKTESNFDTKNIYGDARDKSNTIDNINTGLSAGNFVASHASDAFDVATKICLNVPSSVSSLASTASEFGKVAGPAISGVGAVTSGVSLRFDIANAKKEEKVTFDNAMNIADDATGAVSGIAGMLPGPGSAMALGLTIGEKLVTGGFKATNAVKEEEKREGVKHL
ncbi:hypothetical protein FACS189472_06450 [Alphaproteobacteria bacterium]|nr:hypothetical protein FACS189472_06450 [Alphaproteobacteria bacterium]